MTEIVNLDDLVPPDVEIGYRGKKYIIDGDTSVDDVFRLFSLYRELAEAQSLEGDGIEQSDAVKAAFARVGEHVLALLQTRQPDLDKLPFGMRGLMEVIKIVLAKLGLGIVEEEGNAPPTRPKPAPRSKASTRTRSRASTPARRKTVTTKKKS